VRHAQAGEIADQRLQEKMQGTGRGLENFQPKEKRGMTDFPKRE